MLMLISSWKFVCVCVHESVSVYMYICEYVYIVYSVHISQLYLLKNVNSVLIFKDWLSRRESWRPLSASQ